MSENSFINEPAISNSNVILLGFLYQILIKLVKQSNADQSKDPACIYGPESWDFPPPSFARRPSLMMQGKKRPCQDPFLEYLTQSSSTKRPLTKPCVMLESKPCMCSSTGRHSTSQKLQARRGSANLFSPQPLYMRGEVSNLLAQLLGLFSCRQREARDEKQ